LEVATAVAIIMAINKATVVETKMAIANATVVVNKAMAVETQVVYKMAIMVAANKAVATGIQRTAVLPILVALEVVLIVPVVAVSKTMETMAANKATAVETMAVNQGMVVTEMVIIAETNKATAMEIGTARRVPLQTPVWVVVLAVPVVTILTETISAPVMDLDIPVDLHVVLALPKEEMGPMEAVMAVAIMVSVDDYFTFISSRTIHIHH